MWVWEAWCSRKKRLGMEANTFNREQKILLDSAIDTAIEKYTGTNLFVKLAGPLYCGPKAAPGRFRGGLKAVVK